MYRKRYKKIEREGRERGRERRRGREREREDKREREREREESTDMFFDLKIIIHLFLPKPKPNILPVSKAQNYVPDLVGFRHFSEFQTPFSP